MKQDICEPTRLMAYLNGDLSDQDYQELTSRLESCEECRQQLQQLAASAERWNDVRGFLSRRPIGAQTSLEMTTEETLTPESSLPFAIRQVVALLDPTDDEDSLGRLGGYEVTGVVGSGAMGVVLKAVDRALDRVVALKAMTPTLAACSTARFRFAREARAAAGVLHPNVIAIHGVSTDRDLPYLVMPYIAGTSLQQRMDRQGPLELVEILRIGSQIAAGLAAAHEKGLIHRDIKPSNIMLDQGVETAMITDFGLARTIDDATMTRTGAITGTPEYMSPEQSRGESVDFASDVFSLGSLLYALCTGSRPFRAKTSFGVLRKINDDEATPIRELRPELPAWLCELIGTMHAKSPGDRPSSADVHQQLVACLAHVYQPDRIALPRTLAKPESPVRSFLSRTFATGVLVMTALVLIAAVLASTQPGSFFGRPADNAADGSASDDIVVSESEEAAGDVATPRDEPEIHKTHRLTFPDKTQQGKLVIDITRGFIEVQGHDADDVIIEVLTPPRFRKANQNAAEFQTLFTPKYSFDVNPEENSIVLDDYNQDYLLNLRIRVPYRTDMELDSYTDGYIVAKTISGVLHTHSEHNDITLLEIAGSATAFSRNGDLKIAFRKLAADAQLDFEAYNGSIDLSLPRSSSVSTAIASGASNCRTAFTIEPVAADQRHPLIVARVGEDVDEYQFGTINGGGIPMRLENAKGPITIRRNPAMNPAMNPDVNPAAKTDEAR